MRLNQPSESHVEVQIPGELQDILGQWGLISRPAIVLVGGARRIGSRYLPVLGQAVRVIAQAAESAGSVIVDGGTNAGVMSAIGQERRQHGYTFPLVGVVLKSKVGSKSTQNAANTATLEPNHTHILLVPGRDWGDEAPWISLVAAMISTTLPSITVLINGGENAMQDVICSLLAGRQVLAVRESGRLADRLTDTTTPDALIRHVSVSSRPEALLTAMLSLLKKNEL